MKNYLIQSFILAGLFIAGCDDHQTGSTGPSGNEMLSPGQQDVQSDQALAESKDVNQLTDLRVRNRLERQLREAREATEQFRDIRRAFAAGYADINVIVPHMGFHIMKSALVDSVFDHRHPEILVYDNFPGEREPRLVALEYAVPLTLSQNAPEGFAGNLDRWDRNETFGLWLLHAWVWYPNPDGVFHDTNPLVP